MSDRAEPEAYSIFFSANCNYNYKCPSARSNLLCF